MAVCGAPESGREAAERRPLDWPEAGPEADPPPRGACAAWRRCRCAAEGETGAARAGGYKRFMAPLVK